jgi:RNA polymerase sigma-70 factor, ECF subfamily
MATRRASNARAAADRSFEQLYRGHQADVFRAALRELGNVHDAEDVTQAAFVDAYRAVLRGSRPESPRAWLLAIAENVRRRRYRTASRRPREQSMDADFPVSAERSHEHASALAEALAALPDEQRRVFVLRELGGLSYDEIAAETNSTVGAIQMQLHRARRTLRESLEPPTVTRRRAGLLFPLPGWLSTIASRAEVSLPAIRSAGAIGATAVAVVGGTVAVTEIAADPPPRTAVEPQPAVVAAAVDQPAPPSARPQPAMVVVRSTASTRPRPKARSAVRAGNRAPSTPPSAQPAPPAVAQSAQPAAPEPAAPEPAAPEPAAPETAATAPPTLPVVVETATQLLVERPRLPVRPIEEAERLLELPELPKLPGVPPLPTAPVPEATSGAAPAAGGGELPLPAPSVPPLTVPPAP